MVEFLDAVKYPAGNIGQLMLGGLLFLIGHIPVGLLSSGIIFYKNSSSYFDAGTINLIIISGILSIPLLLLVFAVYGYLVRVIEETMKDNSKLPEFKQENFRYMVKKGIGVFAIYIIYLIVFVLIISLPAITIASIFKPGNITFLYLFLLFDILILIFVFTPLSTLAVVRYGVTCKFTSAFEIIAIWHNFRAGLKNYIIGFIIILAVAFFVELIARIIAVIVILPGIYAPLLLIVLAPLAAYIWMGITTFYQMMIGIRMFANIYNEVEDKKEK